MKLISDFYTTSETVKGLLCAGQGYGGVTRSIPPNLPNGPLKLATKLGKKGAFVGGLRGGSGRSSKSPH